MEVLNKLDREDIKFCLNKYNKIVKNSLLLGQNKDIEGADLFYIHKTIEFLLKKFNEQ